MNNVLSTEILKQMVERIRHIIGGNILDKIKSEYNVSEYHSKLNSDDDNNTFRLEQYDIIMSENKSLILTQDDADVILKRRSSIKSYFNIVGTDYISINIMDGFNVIKAHNFHKKSTFEDLEIQVFEATLMHPENRMDIIHDIIIKYLYYTDFLERFFDDYQLHNTVLFLYDGDMDFHQRMYVGII